MRHSQSNPQSGQPPAGAPRGYASAYRPPRHLVHARINLTWVSSRYEAAVLSDAPTSQPLPCMGPKPKPLHGGWRVGPQALCKYYVKARANDAAALEVNPPYLVQQVEMARCTSCCPPRGLTTAGGWKNGSTTAPPVRLGSKDRAAGRLPAKQQLFPLLIHVAGCGHKAEGSMVSGLATTVPSAPQCRCSSARVRTLAWPDAPSYTCPAHKYSLYIAPEPLRCTRCCTAVQNCCCTPHAFAR